MSNNLEFWKDILGYDGHYQVSNLGRVKSIKFNNEKILKGGINSGGYLVVSLILNKKQFSASIHQLVAMAFLGHVPDGTQKIVVDHINNIKTDNRAENLQLITSRENTEKYHLTRKTSSKYTGVTWHKRLKKWMAKITIDYKQTHLGYFNCETAAHIAYQKALNNLKFKKS